MSHDGARAVADEVVAQVRGTTAEREVAYVYLLELEVEHFSATGGAVALGCQGYLPHFCHFSFC